MNNFVKDFFRNCDREGNQRKKHTYNFISTCLLFYNHFIQVEKIVVLYNKSRGG